MRKAKIKVIKKIDVKDIGKSVEPAKPNKQVAAREVVSTVSTWVSDFQNRKRKETSQAIEKFFSNRPQANGA